MSNTCSLSPLPQTTLSLPVSSMRFPKYPRRTSSSTMSSGCDFTFSASIESVMFMSDLLPSYFKLSFPDGVALTSTSSALSASTYARTSTDALPFNSSFEEEADSSSKSPKLPKSSKSCANEFAERASARLRKINLFVFFIMSFSLKLSYEKWGRVWSRIWICPSLCFFRCRFIYLC